MEDRSMITKRHFALLFAFLLPPLVAFAEQPPVNSEAEKAERVKAITQKYPLKLQRGSGFGNRPAAFCNAFYGAMKRADKAIEYVEPVVKTDDPNHPGLARYRYCDYPLEVWESMYDGNIRLIGDRAFRLYRIDTARKWKNGREEIIYGEQEFPTPEGSLSRFSGYQQVDFKTKGVSFGLIPS